MKSTLVVIFFSIILYHPAVAQVDTNLIENDRSKYLKLYLDGADQFNDFIKQHITFVNYVRDRFEADVHLLVTTRSTASGGTEYTLFFFGQQKCAGKNDTLRYIANTNNTNDETRIGFTKMMSLGLMRYIASFPEAGQIAISFGDENSTKPPTDLIDKWKNWVFTLSINGYVSGEKTYSNLNGYGSISAKKITDEWKLKLSTSASLNKNHYNAGDFIYDSKTESKSGNVLIVKSLSDHWSLGGNANAYHSSYSNYDILTTISPGIEYDIFPYSMSSSKFFTIAYSLTPSYQRYIDTTLYDKTEEMLLQESLSATVQITEKWGSVSTSLSGAHYLHDLSKSNASISATLQWRIVKGLDFNLSGYFSVIHDQLNIPKEGATDEEILTQQKQLGTDYSYSTFFGLSYTFGSIFNNIVNPRFEGGSF